MNLPDLNLCKVAIIGLGYVGLPLAVEFSKKLYSNPSVFPSPGKRIIGFDINQKRVSDLLLGVDETNEIDDLSPAILDNIYLTSDAADLSEADVFIVTVPTPIDISNNPNLAPIKSATEAIAKAINLRVSESAPIIIYESTVYPGVTEEICVPILENITSLELNKGFACGYSPERINPGDKSRKLSDIVKIVSGSSAESASWINNLYSIIINAGTYKAPSIKVAEAAKVIENTQRDINIALVNELAIIFRKLEIDTRDVLKAACTKWNFLDFSPGLVGGHCIGVDLTI